MAAVQPTAAAAAAASGGGAAVPAAYVYCGPGAGTRSVLSTLHSLREALVPAVKVAPLDTAELLGGGWQDGCLLLVMPGGADLPYCKHLNGRGNQLIREYVEGGGAYLGLCAGAYYACARVEFEPGSRLEVVGDRELAFFPGAGVGSIYAGFQYESEAGAVAAPLRFRDRETELEAAAATDAAAGASGGGAGVGGSGAANGSTSGSGSSAALGGGKNRSGPAADGSSASGDVSSSERQRWKESVDYVNAAASSGHPAAKPAPAAACGRRRQLPVGGSRRQAAAAGSGGLDPTSVDEAMPPIIRRQQERQQRQQALQAAQEAMPPASTLHAGHGHPALEALNNATKWVVSAAAFGTLLYRRDLAASWCVLGSVVAAVNCRLLKYAINEARPSGRKPDPGMPSAHGNSLGFLATFVSLAAAASLGIHSTAGLALVIGVPSVGIFLAWLRVALGYHTVAQVVAGWLVGGASAAAWHAWGQWRVLPHAAHNHTLQTQLYAATAAAVAFFVYQNVRRWVREAKQHQALSSGGSMDWS